MKRILLVILFLIVLVLIGLFFYFYSRVPEEGNTITLFGNVDVRQVDLGFRVSGLVVKMPFQEGDLVPKGTLMAVLDKQPYSDLVRQAEGTAAALKAQVENAIGNLERRLKILGTQALSKEDYENAVNAKNQLQASLEAGEAAVGVAKTNLRDTECFAPADGIILTRIREPGTVVREADPVYTLSLFDPIWVRAFIPERLLGVVYPGMPAEVFTDTPNGPTYQGHVGFISPVAEFTPKTVETTQLRTDLVYRLRIIVENPDRGLRQGMPVTVKLRRQTSG